MLETLFATVGKAFNLKGLVSLNSLLILVLSGWAVSHEGDKRATAVEIQNMDSTLGRIEQQSTYRDEEIIRRLERIEDDLSDLKTHLIPPPE